MIRPTIGRSIAARLSAWFTLASALVIAGIGFYLYGALERVMTARQRAPLTAMAAIVRNMMDDLPFLERLAEQPDTVAHVLAGHSRLRLWIYGQDGRALFASPGSIVPKEEWEGLAAPDARQLPTKLWRPAERSTYRLAATRFDSEKAGIGNGFIVLALDVSEEAQLLRLFQATLFVVLPAGMLVAALIGLLIVRRELRPLVRVAKSAREITASHLNERLHLTGMPSELQDLVNSFDTMLARLDDSFRRLSEFSADLAHDLRTPLTSLLGRSQAALLRKRDAEEYRTTLEENVATAERMSALVSDMLFLAQADHARGALAYEKVDLREEVERLIEFFCIACEERGIALEVRGRATAFADRALLQRALSNLLSNAVRHSPDGGRVDVVLGRERKAVTVSVMDRGAGVSAKHALRIFDRFYRADPSRTRVSGGTGLGLAITRSIMRMHGGDVSLKSEPGRLTTFTLTIPGPMQDTPAEAPVRDITAEQPPDPRKTARVISPPAAPAKMTEI